MPKKGIIKNDEDQGDNNAAADEADKKHDENPEQRSRRQNFEY